LHTLFLQDIIKRIETTLSLKLMGKDFGFGVATNMGSNGISTLDTTFGEHKEKNQVKSLFILVITTLVTNLLLKCTRPKSMIQSYSKLSLEEVIALTN
jgi:hypothetical protein